MGFLGAKSSFLQRKKWKRERKRGKEKGEDEEERRGGEVLMFSCTLRRSWH